MCVSQRWWRSSRGLSAPGLPLLLLLSPLTFLITTPPLALGAIQIPKHYKAGNMSQPPVLSEVPESITAFSPVDIHLPCKAKGNPPPTFHWMKDGVLIRSGLHLGTLKAEEEEPLQQFEGHYRCYASNDYGTAMTQSVQVIVEAQPVLPKQQQVHKESYEGESIILSCNPPESSTPPVIHWMDKLMVHISQSERVLVGLDGKLYFSNLLRNDSRTDYMCNAQYLAARTILTESVISLTVVPSNDVAQARKPHFFKHTGPHSSVLALRGHKVTLECIPKGLPTPKVEWKKKDGRLGETSGQLDKHNRWFHFESIGLNDDGEYECKAWNSHGFTTHSFTVTVEAAPYWVKKPASQLYSPGETVRLDCQAEGIPTPSITWSINGRNITEVEEEPRRSVSGGVLILRDVVFADTAVYQCEATNKHGSALLNTFLHVVELPPQILTSDGLLYRVTEGRNILMDCEVFGSPRPHITWEGEDRLPLLSDPRVSLMTNGTLVISEVDHDDAGVYSCSVKHNNNVSINAHLEVYNRTVIPAPPQNLRFLRGTNALLTCGFYTDPRLPPAQVVWRRDGHKLMGSETANKYSVFEDGTLKVSNIQFNDSAQYSCEVISLLDHVKAMGSITVVDRPDPPKYLSLAEVTDHNLTLNWTPGSAHNSPMIDFIVEFREEQHTEGKKWKWEEMKKVPADVQHVQLSLRPFCTYRFRVIAVNEVGRSDPSEPSDTYRTSPAVPDRNPTGVRSESADPDSLVITWDEMDKMYHNGHGFLYEVSWREARKRDARWNSAEVKSPPFLVQNTGTYTPFEIKVKAVNSLGSGPAPEPEIGHSGEDKPAEPPTGVKTTVINSTVTVKWDAAQDVRGLLLGYKIHILRLGPPTERHRRSLEKLHQEEDRDERSKRGKERRLVVVRETSAEVTGLRLFSLYELSVTAYNSKGEGPHSDPHRFSTPEGAPGPPASLRLQSPSETSVILYWAPPTEANGILLGYVIQHKQEGANSESLLQMISDPSVTHFELHHLDPNSYYIFKVIAYTAAGEGPPIQLRGATMLEGVPPSNVTIVTGTTSFNLSWVPEERNRNHGFHVEYLRKSPGADWERSEVVNSTQGFYSLTGLQPGTHYHLKIIHNNDTRWENFVQTVGPVPSEMPTGFAARGWLIGLISAILLLILILLILCLIKRSKGGKYAVKDKEEKDVDSEARPMKDETFGEYSDGDEKRSDSQPSICGDSKLGSDDSLAEYGDSMDIQFNEDGSFIGQYSGRGPVPHGNESSGPTSPVNPVPPPPIAPSMSSILNRPS
ncbi:neural cell adhesion molecule L1-like isoform X2 [Takifugu rubripes]|uniref:neural cell adhesion molecule L1-like isoform X2 n=1 Tax=Takifugu rubripes TaxID=31033 RepID=UPI0011456BAD|nr:neural cell adhesion molecule L1-like isoform X2 [Takifugu rubripes]XP_029690207.1 neural cell adhesion molecule L1-like isoform X2 [Takifugu rubripes]